jgi:hypothetical protein
MLAAFAADITAAPPKSPECSLPLPPSPAPATQAAEPESSSDCAHVKGDQLEQKAFAGAIKNDPQFAKYFKMLQMHVPKGAVAAKMTQEGLDPAVLDMDPNQPLPGGGASDVAIKDDPRFAKFLKMLQMHVPKGAVAAKMTQEGLDPEVLDMDLNKPVPTARALFGRAVAEAPESKVRRKRLHWKGIEKSRLQAGNSIWSRAGDEESSGIVIDEVEFDELFTAKDEEKQEKPDEKAKKPEVFRINIIDGKRAMNGAIALARVRISHEDIASALRSLRVRAAPTPSGAFTLCVACEQ